MLSRAWASSLAAAIAAGPAVAESMLPPPIAEAFAVGEARMEPGQRWAYTCSLTLFEKSGGVVEADGATVVARYDPRRPEEEEWRLVSPESEDALTEGQRHVWESVPTACMSLDRPPGPERPRGAGCRTRPSFVHGPRRISRTASRPIEPIEVRPPEVAPLVVESEIDDTGEVERIVVTASCGERAPPPTQWDQLRDVLDEVTLVEESETELRYGFRLRAPGAATNVLLRPLLRHFDGELAVTAQEPRLVWLRLYIAPFRVPGMARLDGVDVVIHFEEVEPGGPIAATRVAQRGKGHAMRRGFEDESTAVWSDFERVEVVADP